MKLLQAYIVIALIIGLASCAGVPILNIKDAPIRTLSGKEMTQEQVTKAIVLAGMGLKWNMDVAAPGHIVGTLDLRSHQAVVDITYDTKRYNITYKSSQNLLITDGNGREGIHPNYNGWIQNLDNAIRTQVVAIGS